jgi:methylmalonyl-CoA mutase cobalamin-binding domain/chain
MNPVEIASAFAEAFQEVEEDAIHEYTQKTEMLEAYVNKRFWARDDIRRLFGDNPVAFVEEQHKTHVRYMASILRLKSGRHFVNALRWLYRIHISRGVSADYFAVVAPLWREAAFSVLGSESSRAVGRFYDFLILRHPFFAECARNPAKTAYTRGRVPPAVDEFITALLKPSVAEAVALTGAHVKSPSDIGFWWQEVIEPSLYHIGWLWEEGLITVGQEHLATAIVQRVMSIFHPKIDSQALIKGKVLIAATPNELHEVGPRMVAHLLEADGRPVIFTGADTHPESIAPLMKKNEIRFLCLSTTVSFHLTEVETVVKTVRGAGLPFNPYVVVGGQAYFADPELWSKVGADAIAGDANQLITVLNEVS